VFPAFLVGGPSSTLVLYTVAYLCATLPGGVEVERGIILNQTNFEKLKSFKKIFEAILDEKFEFNDYVNAVIAIGLDKLLRDAIPQGQEWNVLRVAFSENYDTMCELLADLWRRGTEASKKDKQTIKDRMSIYIH